MSIRLYTPSGSDPPMMAEPANVSAYVLWSPDAAFTLTLPTTAPLAFSRLIPPAEIATGSLNTTPIVFTIDRCTWPSLTDTPCTAGTYDLYWMAVDPAVQHAGVGTVLVAEMERQLLGRARLVVVETAGRAAYDATRAFYQARGYRPTARIPDFYSPGDDLVVYTKSLVR